MPLKAVCYTYGMKDSWHDNLFASHWDATSNAGNPTRQQQLEILTKIVKATYQPGSTLLDLGIGSGQVEKLLFTGVPGLSVVGVDSSKEMLRLAKERLVDNLRHTVLINHDLTEVSTLKLDATNISVILSVQALHELTHSEKQSLFKYVYSKLIGGGYYLIVDRFTINASLEQALTPVWDYLEEHAGQKSGQSFSEYVKKVQDKQDFTATPQQHMEWLEQTGFLTECVYINMDRGIIVARKAQ